MKCRRSKTEFDKIKNQMDSAGGVAMAMCEERLVVVTDDKRQLHFRRASDAAEWSMNSQPMIWDVAQGNTSQKDYRRLVANGRLPSGPCSITSEDFAPLRTAKIHVALRQEPLQAMQQMQDIMCHLIRFECRECRVRFPAFHPNYKFGLV